MPFRVVNLTVTPEIENAIRSVARECRKAMIAEIKAGGDYDKVATNLLDQYARRIAAVPPNTFSAKQWLVYYVRLIEREAKGQK